MHSGPNGNFTFVVCGFLLPKYVYYTVWVDEQGVKMWDDLSGHGRKNLLLIEDKLLALAKCCCMEVSSLSSVWRGSECTLDTHQGL